MSLVATVAALLGLDLLEEFPDLAKALAPPGWHSEAACRGMGPGQFFPAHGQNGTKARAICEKCPVAASCFAQAIETEAAGIWAGTTERERKRQLAA